MKQTIPYSLEELAVSQLELSQIYCSPACKSYHSSWAILRAFGLVGGIDSDKEIYLNIINTLFTTDRKIKILIAGCADSGIVNMLLGSKLSNYHIDIVDRCETPLLSCMRALNFHDNITTIQSDLLTFNPLKPYDLIVCHSLLPFFNDVGRKKLLKNFAQWLKQDGKLLVSLREKTLHLEKKTPEENSLQAYEKLKQTHFVQKDAFTLEDLQRYYTLIENQNLPYRGFDDGIKEFQEFGLEVVSTIYGGIGISFCSNGTKPRSLIFLTQKQNEF